ncbi:MAG: GDSL-type esterase/lipase family protein [Clostridium sp.]|uniref:SGNH/GDSL hydrolase family protein n=1 Tax=Clostridium sp. TaxID=1506 RepID=UPI0029146C84|nr:GDSL-type esterase/lipase family protein [Clostridium sp.]MDU6876472.1 GDSL-type esterase/lipase family protein [Clostridium sp.]MDU6937517.1 GDSL-type esterase/lipase family protein [Clostridium sp.]
MKFLNRISLKINEDFYDRIKVKQNDTARYLLFNLLDNGVPFSLENKTVRVYGVKPDGTKVFNNLTIINAAKGLAELQLTTQMLVKPGCLKLELVIYEATDILSTTKFDIDIISCIRDDGAIESTNEFSALTLGLSKLDEWDKYFKETSGAIEEKYTERLNGIASSLEETKIQKVDKEEGKGLSTNDYSNVEKAEVAKVKDKMNIGASFTINQFDTREGKVEEYHLSEELLLRITGKAPVSSVPSDLSVSPHKVVPGAINFDKLDYDNLYSSQYYAKALLCSGSNSINYASGILDLVDKRIESAKVIFKFRLKNNGTEKPLSIGAKLFANNSDNREDISEYCAVYNNLVATPEYDKTYVVTCNYIATSNSKNLNEYRYLKPFLVLNKTTASVNTTHAVDVYEVSIEIGEKLYNITNTVQDYHPYPTSKVDILTKDKYFVFRDEFERIVSEISKTRLPWYGKVCNCIGDSITYGLDPNSPSERLVNPYPSQLRDLCGFVTVNNYGISSSTVATKSSDSNWNAQRNPMVLRYKQMVDADVITFLGGINDFWLNVPLGTLGSTDTDTFYGALNVLFRGLVTKYPTKPILAMTILDYKNATNGNGNTLVQFRQAVKDVCAYYSIPVFDLGIEVGFSTRVESQVTALIPDKLHPNQSGVDIMARKISKCINCSL